MVVTAGAIRRAKVQIVSTNKRTPSFLLQVGYPSCRPTNKCPSTEGRTKNCNAAAGCCVYEKPRIFGESDDESDGDDDGGDDHGCTEHCRGHGKKDYRKPAQAESSAQSADKAGASAPRDIGASK